MLEGNAPTKERPTAPKRDAAVGSPVPETALSTLAVPRRESFATSENSASAPVASGKIILSPQASERNSSAATTTEATPTSEKEKSSEGRSLLGRIWDGVTSFATSLVRPRELLYIGLAAATGFAAAPIFGGLIAGSELAAGLTAVVGGYLGCRKAIAGMFLVNDQIRRAFGSDLPYRQEPIYGPSVDGKPGEIRGYQTVAHTTSDMEWARGIWGIPSHVFPAKGASTNTTSTTVPSSGQPAPAKATDREPNFTLAA